MVLANVPTDDLHFQLRTYLPSPTSNAVSDVAAQQRFSVLRDPHKVQLDVESRVASFSVVFHSLHTTEVVAWKARVFRSQNVTITRISQIEL